MPARSPGSLYPTAAHTGATSRQIPPTVKKIICVPRRPNLKAVERQWQGSEWSREGGGKAVSGRGKAVGGRGKAVERQRLKNGPRVVCHKHVPEVALPANAVRWAQQPSACPVAWRGRGFPV